MARMNDKRWTVRCTEWQVRHWIRSRGRPRRTWNVAIQQWQGATWSGKARDRQQWGDLAEGLLSAAEGRSLGIRYQVSGIRSDQVCGVASYFQ